MNIYHFISLSPSLCFLYIKIEIAGTVLFLTLIFILCFIIYDSIPSKYTKLEESFGGFMNRCPTRFEYEKSPLHTVVYGGTGTGKTYFNRPYLKLYLDYDQDPRTDSVCGKQSSYTDQNQLKNIVMVCKYDRDWINPDTGEFYIGFNKCDINMTTSKSKKNMSKFKNCVIVLDDMGDNLNKDITCYFREGRHYNIQMIVMCHKPAQIINTARMSCDTIYLTTYNVADLFKNFKEKYKCEHDFSKIISELNSNHYNRTDGMSGELRYAIIKYNRKENTFIIIKSNRTMIYVSRVGFLDLKALSLKDKLESEDINKLIAYMKPLMINATVRSTINHNNYQFYFNKLVTLNNIKIQNDVLSKELVKGNFLKQVSIIMGIAGWGFIKFNYIYPNAILRNAGAIAMGVSNMLNRTNTLVNVAYGEDMPSSSTDLGNDLRSDYTDDLRSDYADSETGAKPNPRSGYTYSRSDYTDLKNSLVSAMRKLVTSIQEDYIDEERGFLYKEGLEYLTWSI